ncbi:unnamed protein product [Urochloa humidicola]
MSRQARKEAATAARDLLKLDAARVRKGLGGSAMRKGAGPAMQKGAAPAMQKGVAAAMRCDAAGTPPRSFTDGDFFSSPGCSSQPWNHLASDPAMWGTNATPQGGFTNLIQPQMSQNIIFGGEASQYASFRCTQTTQDA